MLREPVTNEMIEQWKKIFLEYKDKLKPNRKTGQEIVEYLTLKYDIKRLDDKEAEKVVYYNIMENEPLRKKLPSDTEPRPITFLLNDRGNNTLIGIDLVSGYYCVEDNEKIWDELCAFQGLDEEDLKNYYSVAEYVICLKKLDMLE